MPNGFDGPEFLSVRETARRLGVHENTIRNWARDGTIVSSRVPGTRAHRFARSEVERLIASRGKAISTSASSRRVAQPELATASDLTAWAATEAAKGDFPELMRRLLAATTGITDLDVRAHEGIAAGGWDGRAHSTGSTFVPAGELRLEFGTNANAKAKAQEDYDKRSADDNAHATTFIFATPRNWAGAASWAESRREKHDFADVHAWDAHKLEGWLQDTPAVHYWISERLGLRPRSVQTIGQWWETFSSRMRMNVPMSMFTAGRSLEADRLRESLTGSNQFDSPVVVKAPTEDEALAFICGAIAGDFGWTRTVVVQDPEAWTRLASSKQRLTLIPAFKRPDLSLAKNGSHQVLLLADASVAVQGATVIELRKIDRAEGATALRQANGADDGSTEKTADADALVALARRSVPAFVRMLAADMRLETPSWASNLAQMSIIAPLFLAGQWCNTAGDRDVLEALTAHSWTDIERLLKSFGTSGDAPFVQSGGIWRLASPTESALLLASHLTDNDIQKWCNAVLSVLTEPDPFAGMSETERLTASVAGTKARFSDSLRTGLAESLALIGSLRTQLTNPSLVAQVDRLAHELFESANEDQSGATWARLAEHIPDLAEASPDQFLDALDIAMAGPTPLITTMFRDSREGGVFGHSSPHPYLLWGLERLCFSTEYFGRAAGAMCELVRIDPGGRLSNRPLETLAGLLAPWIASTAGALEDKLSVVARALKPDRESGWHVALSVWPDRNAVVVSPTGPKYRDWTPRERAVSVRDWLQFIHSLVPMVLEAAGESAEHWSALIPKIVEVPSAERAAVLTRLGEVVKVAVWTDDERFCVWSTLVKEAERHSEFPDADWSLPAEEIATYREFATVLEPTSDPRRFASLFAWRVNFFGRHLDDGAVAELQREAVAEVSTGGIVAIEALALEVDMPHLIGRYLAEQTDATDDDVLRWLSSEDDALCQVATTYVSRCAHDKGAQWVTEALASGRGDVAFQTGLVESLPWQPAIWKAISAEEAELEKPYWHRRIHPVNVDEKLHDEVILQLLDHDEVWGALEFAADCQYADALMSAKIVKTILIRLREHNEPPENPTSAGHALQSALELLEQRTPNDPDLPVLEFTWFSFLHDHHPSRALFCLLNSDPQEFVELVKSTTRADSESVRDQTPQEQAFGRVAFDVLRNWVGLPGMTEDGSIDSVQLLEWVRHARRELAAYERESVGDELVGEVLSHSPAGSDEAWPAEPVREVIEMTGNVRLETGLMIGRSNQRGVTSRGVFDGGDQERVLSAEYRKAATVVRTRWPRTARLLTRLAESCEQDARWHDANAERLADGP